MNTSRISISAGIFLIGFAVFIDFLQFLLDIAFIGFILDSIISIIAGTILGWWFSLYGISLMSPDRVLGFLATFGAELVPGLNAIPVWSFKVGYTVIEEWRSPEEI